MTNTDKVKDAQSFISNMTLLLEDPRFNALSRFNQNRVWFDLLSLKEIHYCTILEWLFSPHEGHGLGSFFLKRFLLAATSAAATDLSSNSSGQTHIQSGLTIGQVHTVSLDQAVVGREIKTSLPDDEEGRIDLLILEPQSETVIVIERKDGSTVTHDQLRRYRSWVEKKFRGYRMLFVLSDSWQHSYTPESTDNWIQVDDSWLIDALKEALIPGRLPVSVHERLEDLLYHFDADGEYRDPFHHGIEKELQAFAFKHRNVLQRLQTNKFSRINARTALSEWISVVDQSSSDCVKQAVILANRHHTLLQGLIAIQCLEVIKDALEQKIVDIDLKFELFTNTMHIGTSPMQALVNQKIVQCWPVTLKLFLPNKGNDDSLSESKDYQTPTVEILMDLRAFGDSQYEKGKGLAISEGLEIRRRWASRTTEITHAELSDTASMANLIEEVKRMNKISLDWDPDSCGLNTQNTGSTGS